MQLSLLPPALAFGCALASLTIGALLLGTAVRGYHPSHRVFPQFAFCATLYGGASVAAYIGNSEVWEVGAARFQAAMATLFILLVQRYATLDLGPWPRAVAWAARTPPLLGLFIYEAFGLTGQMRHVWLEWLRYSLPAPQETAAGLVGTLLMATGVAIPLARYWYAAARRVPEALLHATAFSVLFLGAAAQILGAAGVLPIFDLAPAGCSVALLILARVVSRRWRGDLHSLEDLRDQLEAKVEQRSRELAELHRQLARSERLAAVGRLSAGLAHALNNPGAVVVANLEYLKQAGKNGAQPADLAEVVSESLQAARRLTNTVRRLMVFSRAAGAEPQHGSGAFDLSEAVERAVRPLLQAQTAQPGPARVKLETQTPPGLRVRGRSALLEQALGEVLQNALAAIPEGQQDGRVAVDASAVGGKILLKVSDNGVGIAPEVHQAIFEPFSTFRTDGGEVGLAMVVGLLRALGGDVRVDSSPGRGSTFTFVLEAESG